MATAAADLTKPYSYVRNLKQGSTAMAEPHHASSIDWGFVGQVGSWIVGGLGLLGITKQNIPKISQWIVKKLDTETAKQARLEAQKLRHLREDRADALENSRSEVAYLRAQVDRLLSVNSEQSHQINELLLKVAIKSEKVEQAAKAAQVIDNLIKQSGKSVHDEA